MDLKIVFVCLVFVAVAAGGTINKGHLRKFIHDKLVKKAGGGQQNQQQVGQGQGQGDSPGRNLVQNAKAAIMILENTMDDLVNFIMDSQMSNQERQRFTNVVEELLDDLRDLGVGIIEFLGLDSSASDSFETTDTSEPTDTSGTTTESGSTETTDESTTTEASSTTEATESTTSETTPTESTTSETTTTESTTSETTTTESTTSESTSTTSESTTTAEALPSRKRLLNLRKTLLKALLENMKEKNRK